MGTQEWQAEEMAAKRSFLNAVFRDEVEVKQWEPLQVEEDGETAKVRVKTLLVSPDGGIDNEPMRFTLTRIDDKWWISALS